MPPLPLPLLRPKADRAAGSWLFCYPINYSMGPFLKSIGVFGRKGGQKRGCCSSCNSPAFCHPERQRRIFFRYFSLGIRCFAPSGLSMTAFLVLRQARMVRLLSGPAAQSSRTRPSVAITVTCQGISLPLLWRACRTACSSPPQQGTSMRTMWTLLMSLRRRISPSFSA